jgi:hypothetical protein
MLRKAYIRWIAAFLATFVIAFTDYLIQIRLPPAGPHQDFEDSWWYKSWNWTMPPENQRDMSFWIYSAILFVCTVIIAYFLLTRWQRRREIAATKT